MVRAYLVQQVTTSKKPASMTVVAGGHPAVGVPGVAGGLADGGVFVLTKAVGRDEFDEWYESDGPAVT